MNNRLIVLLIATTLSGGCQLWQPSQRAIPYNSKTPIAERLRPDDKQVLVEMKLSTPPLTTVSLDQEITALKKGEIIALVRIAGSQGEVADRGTWIRTKVHAEFDRLVQAPPDMPLGASIEFNYGGGTSQIGNVVVTTGKFARFVDAEQYLVWLAVRPGTASELVWEGKAFRVDANGTLQRVGISDGSEQSFYTNLIGRNVSEVIDTLKR